MYERIDADPARDDMLVLVDGLDREIGQATKIQAHVDALLHRAFSVVLVRDGADGPELLLSRRAKGKYHSGGLWANSCCSHPRAGEELLDAARRRTGEELGCRAENLVEIGTYVYRAVFENGITEFEYDHVFLGTMAGELACDPAEVSETRWVAAEELASELASHPERFSAWAPGVLSIALAHLAEA